MHKRFLVGLITVYFETRFNAVI